MKIEMLYPEVCNLFGDVSNIKYLKKWKCLFSHAAADNQSATEQARPPGWRPRLSVKYEIIIISRASQQDPCTRYDHRTAEMA